MPLEHPELPDDEDVTTLPKGLRHGMIARIVRVVVPKLDLNAPYDARMLEFLEYCKYLERKTFERSQTRDEYYAMLAEIIFNIQKRLELRQKGSRDDPYSDIPMPHELADFMGLTQEELEEFDEQQNPQGPSAADESNSKEKITTRIRENVVEKLGTMLFPAPDAFARYDGRMDTITEKLREIEACAYRDAEDRDDYYNRASLAAYRLQKNIRNSGESYIDAVVRYPVITTMYTENVEMELPDISL